MIDRCFMWFGERKGSCISSTKTLEIKICDCFVAGGSFAEA